MQVFGNKDFGPKVAIEELSSLTVKVVKLKDMQYLYIFYFECYFWLYLK